jgi:hypothetical protein
MSAVTIPTASAAIRAVVAGELPDYSAVTSSAQASIAGTELLTTVFDLLDVTDLVNDIESFGASVADPAGYAALDTEVLEFSAACAEVAGDLAVAIDDAREFGLILEEPTALILRSTRLVFVESGVDDNDEAGYYYPSLDPQSTGGVSFYGTFEPEFIQDALTVLAAVAARIASSVITGDDRGYSTIDEVLSELV